MGPGNFVKDPISAISFGMALMFGTAGLPHILMRFFTVPSAKAARTSVMWATGWIGYFYLLTFIIGFGAITFVLTNPQFLDAKGGLLGGGNMAAIHLANAVGGNVFLGFISAVAFATILAVVAGLTLSGASAVSHDIYATVVKKGTADSASELRVSKITTICLGIIAVVLGIAFEKQNIAFMVSPGLRHRRVGQLPGALHERAVEGLHHARRGHRRLPRADQLGGADRGLAVGVGSHARQPQGLGAVPVHQPGAVLDDHRLRRHLVVLDPGQQPACQGRPRRLPGAAGTQRNRHRRGRRVGPLSEAAAVAIARATAALSSGLRASASRSLFASDPPMTAAFDFDVPPFDTLNAAQQALVRATASLVRFAADDPVLTPEMEPTHAFLLVEGHVRRAAGVLPEATYGAGTLFGARALLSARATSTSVALDEVTAWQIPKATLQSLLSANPAFCAAVFAEIARRLSRQEARSEQREFLSLMMARVRDAYRAQALLCRRRARPGAACAR